MTNDSEHYLVWTELGTSFDPIIISQRYCFSHLGIPMWGDFMVNERTVLQFFDKHTIALFSAGNLFPHAPISRYYWINFLFSERIYQITLDLYCDARKRGYRLDRLKIVPEKQYTLFYYLPWMCLKKCQHISRTSDMRDRWHKCILLTYVTAAMDVTFAFYMLHFFSNLYTIFLCYSQGATCIHL